MPFLVYKTNLVFQRKPHRAEAGDWMHVHTSPASAAEWRMRGTPNPLLLPAGSTGSCSSSNTELSVHGYAPLVWYLISTLFWKVKQCRDEILMFSILLFCSVVSFMRLLWQLLSSNASDANFLSCCQLWPELWLDSGLQDTENLFL